MKEITIRKIPIVGAMVILMWMLLLGLLGWYLVLALKAHSISLELVSSGMSIIVALCVFLGLLATAYTFDTKTRTPKYIALSARFTTFLLVIVILIYALINY